MEQCSKLVSVLDTVLGDELQYYVDIIPDKLGCEAEDIRFITSDMNYELCQRVFDACSVGREEFKIDKFSESVKALYMGCNIITHYESGLMVVFFHKDHLDNIMAIPTNISSLNN